LKQNETHIKYLGGKEETQRKEKERWSRITSTLDVVGKGGSRRRVLEET